VVVCIDSRATLSQVDECSYDRSTSTAILCRYDRCSQFSGGRVHDRSWVRVWARCVSREAVAATMGNWPGFSVRYLTRNGWWSGAGIVWNSGAIIFHCFVLV